MFADVGMVDREVWWMGGCLGWVGVEYGWWMICACLVSFYACAIPTSTLNIHRIFLSLVIMEQWMPKGVVWEPTEVQVLGQPQITLIV